MTKLADSNLILNSRGTIYHLGLHPEEIAETILLVTTSADLEKVSGHFDLVEVKHNNHSFITHTGVISGKRISVISTGIGTGNIDIVMNELDALVNVDFETKSIKPQLTSLSIIRIGKSEALQPDIPVDSFVASTHGLGIDNLLNTYRHVPNDEEMQIIQQFVAHTQISGNQSQPYIFTAAPSLLKHFVDGFFHGITITAPGFYGPQGRVLRLGLTITDIAERLCQFAFGNHRIVNCDMETSAFYGLGKLLGHSCISLNVVVANRVTKQAGNTDETFERLISKALQTITSIP